MAETTTAPPPVTDAANGSEATGQPEKKERKPRDPKPFGVFKKVNIGRDTSADDVLKVLQEIAGEGDKPIYLLVRAGQVKSTSAKRAVEALGEERDLKGNYEVIADKARTEIKNVSTETKRRVVVG